MPISLCRALGPDSHLLHQVGILEIGSTLIASQAGTPTEFIVEDTPDFHLLACFQGRLQLGTAAGEVTLVPNGAVLIPAGLRHSNGAHSLASVTLNPAAVASAATAMAGSPQLTRLLALDDQLHRTAALLLHPELLEQEPVDLHRCREKGGRGSFDDLIDYIRANLDQRLSLSELEARSHYSRRALQYAFRQRLNTTPKQWIREQRLTHALEVLRQDGPRPSVKEVAFACGYSHLGHFTKDFKTRFGLKPSEARRT